MRHKTIDPFSFKSFLPLGTEFEGENGGGSPAPEPIKTADQIEAEIASALAGEEPVESTEPINIPDVTTEPPVKTEPVTKTEPIVKTDFTPNPIWNFIKADYEKQIGENTFKMPEGITAENEHEMLLNFLHENVEPDTSNYHPFVKEVLQAAADENFDPNKFLESKIKQKTYLDLPNDEFLKMHLTNIAEYEKTGWTEEDINNHIENKKKDKIGFDAEVNSIKGQYLEYETKLAEKQVAEQKIKQEQEFQTIIDKRNKDISTLIEQNKTLNDFYGITFGEAELKEFHKWLPEMLQVNKETGSYPLLDYMRSDVNLMKIAAIVYKTEKGMRDYLTDIKEGTKSDLMTKLRLTPQSDGGSIVTKSGLQPITGNE